MFRPLVVYQVSLLVSALVAGFATWIAWSNRRNRGGSALAVLLAASTVWTSATLVEMVWYETPFVIYWSKVVVMSSVGVVVASFLVFALAYTGRDEYVTWRTAGLLAIEPLAFLALVATNRWHGLVWQSIELTELGTDGARMVSGPAYAAHTQYSYLLVAIAVVLLVVFLLRSKHLYRRQATTVVVAAIVPWLANVVYQATTLAYDPTPVAFTVTALAFTWAIVREEFLDITPVATELVLDTIDTAVFVVDGDSRVVEINDSALDLFDVTTDEAVGADAPSLVSRVPNARDVYDDVAPTRESTTREFQSGDRYLRILVSPLIGDREELVGQVFLVVDLTEQRRREEQLRQRNERLDRFAGVVSHDLRNPLEVASGSLQLARETGDDEHFDRAARAHERMERLVEDLLTLARQDVELGITEVKLGAVARSAWKYVETADATLSVEDADEIVEADRDRLIQLFENLFRNAIEHGGDDVVVTVESFPGGFAVTDDGRGFDGVDVDDVFDEGTTTAADGTGFGLAIVEEIATNHGWRISASEGVTGGARFEFYVDGREAT